MTTQTAYTYTIHEAGHSARVDVGRLRLLAEESNRTGQLTMAQDITITSTDEPPTFEPIHYTAADAGPVCVWHRSAGPLNARYYSSANTWIANEKTAHNPHPRSRAGNSGIDAIARLILAIETGSTDRTGPAPY